MKKNEIYNYLSLSSPAMFAYFASGGKWKPAPHLLDINNELIKIANSQSHRLIINLPPRHGKSEFISKYFIAWYLTVFPTHKIMLTSYNESFASSWCGKVKTIINEFSAPQYGISISAEKNTANEFSIKRYGGGLYCIGAGGSITGRGADLIIIDDPIKNDAQANSANFRDNLWDWFKATLLTRLEPNGKLIIAMTRWHNDDLTGRIMKEFHNINLGEQL